MLVAGAMACAGLLFWMHAQRMAHTTNHHLLSPFSMGTAPYAYIPYGDVNMAEYASNTGVRTFFGAFVLGSDCTPLWDGNPALGLTSSRSAAIKSDIQAVRSGGGDVVISFGGQKGTELADSCTDASRLQTAYQSVISTYGAKHVNFDIENSAETDSAGLVRRASVVRSLQQANAGLRVSLTIPVEPTGLSHDSLNVLKTFHDYEVVLSSIDIMAMDFGDLPGDQSPRITSAAKNTVDQMKRLYAGVPATDLWKALGIVVLLGKNDTSETFTLADAQIVHDFAVQNGVGTISYWNANRDQPCGGDFSVANGNCSGVAQTAGQFARLLTVPAK